MGKEEGKIKSLQYSAALNPSERVLRRWARPLLSCLRLQSPVEQAVLKHAPEKPSQPVTPALLP